MLTLRVLIISPDGDVRRVEIEALDMDRAEGEFYAECGEAGPAYALHGTVYGPDPDEPGSTCVLRTFGRPAGLLIASSDQGERGPGIVYRPESPAMQRDLFA